jgi:hypothetical protein
MGQGQTDRAGFKPNKQTDSEALVASTLRSICIPNLPRSIIQPERYKSL